MNNNLSVCIIQTDLFWENPQKNIENISAKLSGIESNIDLVVLPEMFTTGFSLTPAHLAETMNGKTVSWLKSKANEINAAITGSIVINDNGKFYNRLIWMSPDGNYSYYDKRHLFRMAGEHEKYSSGNKQIIVKHKQWRIKPLICYDLRFPVWSRNKNDYDILIYIANWPAKRRTTWLALLKARAIENQSYVIAVNRIGVDGNELKYSGDSIIFNPLGEQISKSKTNEEFIDIVELPLDSMEMYRRNFPISLDADDFNIVL